MTNPTQRPQRCAALGMRIGSKADGLWRHHEANSGQSSALRNFRSSGAGAFVQGIKVGTACSVPRAKKGGRPGPWPGRRCLVG